MSATNTRATLWRLLWFWCCLITYLLYSLLTSRRSVYRTRGQRECMSYDDVTLRFVDRFHSFVHGITSKVRHWCSDHRWWLLLTDATCHWCSCCSCCYRSVFKTSLTSDSRSLLAVAGEDHVRPFVSYWRLYSVHLMSGYTRYCGGVWLVCDAVRKTDTFPPITLRRCSRRMKT